MTPNFETGMKTRTGWLFDLYPDPLGGACLWLMVDGTAARLRLRMDFPVTFFAAGNFAALRQAWRFLRQKDVRLARAARRDLFSGRRDVLAITAPDPAAAVEMYRALSGAFPTLDYYDADIPLPLRFAAQTGVSMLGRCRVDIEGERVSAIAALNSPWEHDPAPLPLRVLELRPDVDPALGTPRTLRVAHARADYALSLEPARALEAALGALLRQFDPDLILTDFGDTWLLPRLQLNPNRDERMATLTRPANSYFAYGQVIHRGAQAHLFGRWHIDCQNALLFGEVGLEGVLEQARVSALGPQEMARKSPGAGITAMQMLTALRTGVLVPVVKQQAEEAKTLTDLVQADKGGLIYQPLTGLHRNVAQIDFASMYPSIMVAHNISPETLGKPEAPEGLVPQTLRPLLEKRLALKRLLVDLPARDCRVPALRARAAALKWLLVVCFGYLGYKNARFGRIEGHEAVTAASRERMLQAKEAAEALGFTVIHMYVDSLFVQKDGCRAPAEFAPLLEAIHACTGIPIALEGVYRWLVFPPSRRDARIPVPNRYFGVFASGEIKTRGIALRRHDTCPFAAGVQLGALEILSRSDDPAGQAVEAWDFVNGQLRRLRAGQIPLADLRLAQNLSRAPEAYRTPSPAALAAMQLQARGVVVRPGMRLHFWYVHGGVKVADVSVKEIDVKRYARLAQQAAEEVIVFKPHGPQRGW